MSGDRITLDVNARGSGQLGSRNVRRLRREGLVPGVLYGSGEPVAIAVGERELRTALSGPSGLHAIVDVIVDGSKPHHAVLKEFQRHPVRGTVTHVDFHEVRLDRPIQTTVSIQLVGEAPGVKVGGVLQQGARDLRVEALPAQVPEHVEIDLGNLELGDVLRLEDVPAIEGVTFLDDPHETVIVSCVVARVVSLEPEEEEVEAAEGEEPSSPAEEAPAEE